MESRIPDQVRADLETLISSEDSPVGIDAKKTHVLILFKLQEIERRLVELEKKLDRTGG